MNLRLLKNEFNKNLENKYSKKEADILFFIILKKILNFSKADFIFNENKPASSEFISSLKTCEKKLIKNMPIQYILEEAEFYGLNFFVNQDVLIPRPETEELVDIILKENKQANLSILDIGTGSGCIAVSIAKNRESWDVSAIDISEKALHIAKKNALNLKTEVNFILLDILSQKSQDKLTKYDIIISNPPYVKDNEKPYMKENVLNFEPHSALFVSDNQPLVFYEKIAEISSKHLNKDGKIYLEINEFLYLETAYVFEKIFSKVNVIDDLFGKKRFLKIENFLQ